MDHSFGGTWGWPKPLTSHKEIAAIIPVLLDKGCALESMPLKRESDKRDRFGSLSELQQNVSRLGAGMCLGREF